jgi:hypothetical protein
MSFTIKCDKCGNEQSFKQGDKARNTKIDMEIGMSGGYQPYPNEITLFCENPKCNNMVDLKY